MLPLANKKIIFSFEHPVRKVRIEHAKRESQRGRRWIADYMYRRTAQRRTPRGERTIGGFMNEITIDAYA